jgi:hypothetical protein
MRRVDPGFIGREALSGKDHDAAQGRAGLDGLGLAGHRLHRLLDREEEQAVIGECLDPLPLLGLAHVDVGVGERLEGELLRGHDMIGRLVPGPRDRP